MTSEESISSRDEEYSVHVKAQVMTRDESTGGWVPLGGGGMSLVGLQKNSIRDGTGEYTIIGQKLSDQTVVLSCAVKDDLKYVRANPTFHHWITEDKRFGLTFQSSADAQVFEKSIRDALKVIHGVTSLHDVDVVDEDAQLQNVLVDKKAPAPSFGAASARNLGALATSETLSQAALLSSRDIVGRGFGVGADKGEVMSQGADQHLYKIHCVVKSPATRGIPLSGHVPQTSRTSSPRVWRTRKSRSEEVAGAVTLADPKASDFIEGGNNDAVKSEHGSSSTSEGVVEVVEYSYVQFAKASAPGTHEYIYPVVELIPKSGHRVQLELSSEPLTASTASPRPCSEEEPSTSQLPLPAKTKTRRKIRLKREPVDRQLLGQLPTPRLQCIYCHEVFSPDANRLGSCKDAPDGVRECIEWVACACCARGMLYHCLSDADGNYGHPCMCEASDDSQCKKWTALALLSLVVPCLWCYWPLTACHRCGMRCGCCGPQHVMAST